MRLSSPFHLRNQRGKLRLVSTSRLNALPRLHLKPINLVIFQEAILPNLEVGFPLICFQRLSLPNIATQRCPWQEQLAHQRFVLSGPLVLRKTLLKQQRLRQIETNLSHDGLNPARVPL